MKLETDYQPSEAMAERVGLHMYVTQCLCQEKLELGDVVVISNDQESLTSDELIPHVALTKSAYDTRVCGIVSAVKIELALPPPEKENSPARAKPAAAGAKAKTHKTALSSSGQPEARSIEELDSVDRTKVDKGQIGLIVASGLHPSCKVDADVAAINVGDLLTTGPTKGHAQKVLDPSKATGAIIGKALGSLKTGKGRIPVLVTLQ